MKCEIEIIGPNEAASMLLRVHERQKGRNHIGVIESYASQMRNGTWDSGVAQTISISDKGELVDGWHRLQAIIRSGATLPFFVVRGVRGEAFAKYDSGKMRSLAFRVGLDKNTAALVSMLMRLIRYGMTTRSPTPEEVSLSLDFLRPELEVFRATVSSTRKVKLTTAAVQLACILRMKQRPEHGDRIARCFCFLQGGDLSQAPKVVFSLYRRLVEENNTEMQQFALAWMAFDISRFDNLRLQLSDVRASVHEARNSVLLHLIDAIS